MEKKSFLQSSFGQRLLSGIVLVAIILFLLISGGFILLLALALISLIGVYELYRVVNIEKTLLGYAGYLAVLLYYGMLLIHPENTELTMTVMLAGLVILLAVYVFTFPKFKADQVMCAFFAFVYVAVMLSYVYRCRVIPGGECMVWLIFLCSWGCDTCAYCAGITMGKHKMTPILSPKKTIEGAIGGVAGAVLLSVLFAFFVKDRLPFVNTYLVFAVVTFIGSLISMIGDLAASAIKRDHSVKDYGTLIPGHGGILDRFDSVIFTAPVIYYTIMFFL